MSVTDPAYRQRYAGLCREARMFVDSEDELCGNSTAERAIRALCSAVEELALDLAVSQPTLLRANDLRLRLLAACPEAAEKIDAVFKAITIPCGPMFERERLEQERDAARAGALNEAADLVADFAEWTSCDCLECNRGGSHGIDIGATRRDIAAGIRALDAGT